MSVYENFLRKMEAARNIQKAQRYTYCIANACVLQREGLSDIHVPLDEEAKQTLFAATKIPPTQTVEPLKALSQRCTDFIKDASAELPFPDSLADEIAKAWRFRLDMDFEIIFIDILNGLEAEYMTPVSEWLRSCAKKSDTILKELPCPLKVAERLRKISMDLYIDGSPLFGWWNQVPDIIRAESYLHRLTRPGAEEAEIASSTDWENAPQAVKDWDMKVVEKMLDNARRRYLTGTRQREESSQFENRSTDDWKAFLKDSDADIAVGIIAELRKKLTVDDRKEIATRLSPEWVSRYTGDYGNEELFDEFLTHSALLKIKYKENIKELFDEFLTRSALSKIKYKENIKELLDEFLTRSALSKIEDEENIKGSP